MEYTEAVRPFLRAAFANDQPPPHPKKKPYERSIAYAIQGGGALTRGATEAVEITLPYIMNRGKVTSVSGPSGAALMAAIISDALNKGIGIEGLSKNFKRLWTNVGNVDTAYGISRFHKMTANPMVGGYFSMIESFAAAAIASVGGPTYKTRDILNQIIGNGDAMRAGPVVPYVNYLRHNNRTGEDDHIIARGSEVTADKVVGSGGLDELGNHRVYDWQKGHFEVLRDGAYLGGANPVITPMIEEQHPTDVVVFTLHGPASRVKTVREQKLNTTEIHRELALLRQQYAGRVNFHVINLDFGDMDHMNTDPVHLQAIADIARAQTLAQLPDFLHNFDHAKHVRFDAPTRRHVSAPERHLTGVA